MKSMVAIILSFFLALMQFVAPTCAGEKRTDKVRLPAVAGSFYPDDPATLKRIVRKYLTKADGRRVSGRIRGLVSPHAGYIYSGIVAAAGYSQIDQKIRTVIVLAPSHHIAFRGASIPEGLTAYRTPLGDVRLSTLAFRLRHSPGFTSVPQAHEREHAIEVQLPFLQVALEMFEIVPILMGSIDPEMLARAIIPFIGKNTLIIASSDLSHYYSYNTARRLDRFCNEAIPAIDFSKMALCEACGKLPILTLMHIAKIEGWKGILIEYKNSGDTAGNKDRVVGYASIAFVEDVRSEARRAKIRLKSEEREYLLQLARSTITARLADKTPRLRELDSPGIKEMRGCFVTIHKDGHLRGCIGTILPVQPLCQCVKMNALNAAFNDPRFYPLRKDELDSIQLEISVLTVPEVLRFKDSDDLKRKLKPNIHGVILSRGRNRATYLPQVWEQMPTKEEFLESLCRKGAMNSNCWQDKDTIVEVYEAEVFSE